MSRAPSEQILTVEQHVLRSGHREPILAHAGLVIATMIGAGIFAWPFIGWGTPSPFATAAVGLGTAAALVIVEILTRGLDTRSLALLAALAALDSVARAAIVTGIGGFSPIFLLILCGGYIFGTGYGFLLGALSLLVSSLVTGGIGPWLPYQLFASGWVGVLAGLAGGRRVGRPGWNDVGILCCVGVISGYGYGAAMDIWNWTFYQTSPALGFHPGMPLGVALLHFGRFYLVTSLVYDSFRAGGNAVMIATLGTPVLVALARIRSRLRTEVISVAETSAMSALQRLRATGDIETTDT